MDSGRKFKKHLINSNPKDLIREIKCRPGLYDKEQLEQPKREHKQQLWKEVAESLTPSDVWESYDENEKHMKIEEIQIKWKNFRNHFLREIKLIRAGKAHTKKKYKYYDDMEFMSPYVGGRLYGSVTPKRKSCDSTDDSCDDEEPDNDVTNDQSLNTSEEVQEESPQRTRRSPRMPVKKQAPPRDSISPPKDNELTKEQKLVINKFDDLKKISQKIRPHSTPSTTKTKYSIPAVSMRDGDISFCLSLVPTMRKLDESKRLKAKIDILTILHRYVDEATPRAKKQKLAENSKNSGNLSEMELKLEDCTEKNMENVWWT